MNIVLKIIPIIISAFSLVVSIHHRWSDYQKEKTNFSIEVRGYLPNSIISHLDKYTIFNIIIKNYSKLDIAVTRIFLKYQETLFEFEWNKQNISIYSRGIQSASLPIHILGMGAYGGYFILRKYDSLNTFELNEKPFEIIVQTSRGIEKSFKFTSIKAEIEI